MAVKKLTYFLKNKYAVALTVFFIWILFFDNNSLISQFRLIFTLSDLHKQEAFYIEQIKNDSTSLYVLKNDPASLEKFARENYLMKKDNEDIFLIVDDAK
ncbi:MAG: septum formation initiator family protein [Bacteroidetes bacterium]|nr:MAG: septum formation initiator family protein [Bacteroidota bacterium]